MYSKISLICFLLGAGLFIGHAQTISQTIELKQGWNAFYLDVTPPDGADSPDLFFKDLPITQVACHIDSRLPSSGSIDSEGNPIVGGRVEFFTWIADNPTASTLLRIVGGAPYYCYATNACTLQAAGRPALPRMYWRNTVQGGLMNLAGVSTDAPEGVTIKDYFQEGPPGENMTAYQIGGLKPEAPVFLPIRNNQKLKRGEVIALSSSLEKEWNGVLDIAVTHPYGILLSEDQPISGMTISNTGKRDRLVRVTLQKSELPSERLPDLLWSHKHEYSSRTDWRAFTEPVTHPLKAGESWHLSLTPDLLKMAGTTEKDPFAAILRVDAVDDPSALRLLVPLTFTYTPPTADAAAFPQGLWVGHITLSQVGNGKGSAPKTASNPFKMRVIVHVDAQNEAHLLQRVVLMPDQENPSRPLLHLLKDMNQVPQGRASTRISSIFLDTANRSVAGIADSDGIPSQFGKKTTFRFTVSENSRENPFRHCWHPNHDGKTMDFKADLPSGDDPKNYIGPIKPEIFSVVNTLTLTWLDIEGKSTFSYTPDQITYGRCDWTLSGLRADGDIQMRGVFALKRICNDPTID